MGDFPAMFDFLEGTPLKTNIQTQLSQFLQEIEIKLSNKGLLTSLGLVKMDPFRIDHHEIAINFQYQNCWEMLGKSWKIYKKSIEIPTQLVAYFSLQSIIEFNPLQPCFEDGGARQHTAPKPGIADRADRIQWSRFSTVFLQVN